LSRQGRDWFCDGREENVQNKVNDWKTTLPEETLADAWLRDDKGVRENSFDPRSEGEKACAR
jgi:hypothetical protein